MLHDNGIVKGWGLLHRSIEREWVFWLYVDKDHRRQGIGTRLCTEAKALQPKTRFAEYMNNAFFDSLQWSGSRQLS